MLWVISIISAVNLAVPPAAAPCKAPKKRFAGKCRYQDEIDHLRRTGKGREKCKQPKAFYRGKCRYLDEIDRLRATPSKGPRRGEFGGRCYEHGHCDIGQCVTFKVGKKWRGKCARPKGSDGEKCQSDAKRPCLPGHECHAGRCRATGSFRGKCNSDVAPTAPSASSCRM